MQTILITGANRGLGLEMSNQYLQAGWQVIACCRSPLDAHELNGLATHSDGKLQIFDLDVKQAESIQRLSQRLQNQTIDILLNNAGILTKLDKGLDNMTSEAWLDSFQVNTIAPALMIKAFIEQVSASQRKIIANISSTLGSISLASNSTYLLYGSSKAALNYLTKSLAPELKSRGITIVSIHPGWVKTDMGGVNAQLTPQESITGIRKVLNTISLKESGIFCDYEGKLLPN